MPKRLTREEVIKRFKEKHGDKYDYSKFVYTGNKAKGIIICPTHGEWSTIPSNHYKYGCIHCGYVSRNKKKTKNPNKLIKELRNIYGNDYDYSQVSYKGNHEKIKLVCKIDNHGQKDSVNLLSLNMHIQVKKMFIGKFNVLVEGSLFL
jgi:hypothetical protein